MSGTRFKGEIEFSDDIPREDLKFILASLFHLNTIGGFKSRGIGKVEVFIEERELKYENTLDEIINDILKNTPIEAKRNIEEKLQKYTYELSLQEPIILTSKEIGNYVEVRDSIQGSSIRGAIIEYFLKRGLPLETLLKIEASEATFGSTQLASAFITKYKIGEEKKEIDKIIDSRIEIEDPKIKRSVKLERKGTALLKARGNEISIAINPKSKSVKDGMLFNSEYLECSEKLQGDILLPEGLVEKNKKYTIYLGKMKSKGFGKAIIEFKNYQFKKSNLKERIERLKEQTKENILTFDLQSDLILPFNDIFDIGEQFKILSGISEIEFRKSKSYINTGKLSGYNIINNIRKVDELIITRGSVLTYEVKDIDKILSKLEEIEIHGLGLRRNEGFGRIKISSERGEK